MDASGTEYRYRYYYRFREKNYDTPEEAFAMAEKEAERMHGIAKDGYLKGYVCCCRKRQRAEHVMKYEVWASPNNDINFISPVNTYRDSVRAIERYQEMKHACSLMGKTWHHVEIRTIKEEVWVDED